MIKRKCRSCSLDINKCFVLYIIFLKVILCSCNQNKNNNNNSKKSNNDGISVPDDERQTRQTPKKNREGKKKSSHIPVKCFVG